VRWGTVFKFTGFENTGPGVTVAKTWVKIAKEWVDIAKSWVEIAMPVIGGQVSYCCMFFCLSYNILI
jgi:hypothetical protein